MSEWQQSVLTAKARDLHAKVEAGELTLNLTKIKLGSGTLENTDNIDTMTDIKHVEQEVGISAKTPKEGGICSITGIITNSSVNVGFYVKELGLFAQDESGTEFLYAYMTDARPDYQPSKDYGGAPVTASYSIDVAISNASKITVTVDPVGLVTTKILDQKILEHNDSDTAHSNVFKSLFNIATVTGDTIKAKIKDYAMEKISEWIADQGIRYNIAQNGYICFGKLFGDAIIQWGMLVWDNEINNGTRLLTFPMIFSIKCYDIIAMHHYENNIDESFLCIKTRDITATNGTVDFYDLTKNNKFYGRMMYFAIGK